MIFFRYLSFSLTHLELKRQIRLYALAVPSKTIPDSVQTMMVNIYTRFQTKTTQKPYPLERYILI